MRENDVNIHGYELRLTCGACPEQYDVLKDGIQVGYLRLRHGTFRADVPDCGGETIYTAHPNGDGCFEDDERERYLREAVEAIGKHYGQPLDTLSEVIRERDEARALLAETGDDRALIYARLAERNAALHALLAELAATVRGECPALLDGDRGGYGKLSDEIDAALAERRV